MRIVWALSNQERTQNSLNLLDLNTNRHEVASIFRSKKGFTPLRLYQHNIQRATSSLPQDPDPIPAAAPESDGPIEYTSPAKVIKMPSKKKKTEPEEAQAEAEPEEQAVSSETGEIQPPEGQAASTPAVHEMDTSKSHPGI